MMARQKRGFSNTGVYHVVFRGINKADVFLDDEDRLKLLYIMKDLQKTEEYQVYAYCIMTNHMHMIVRCQKELGNLMRKILSRYVVWYNHKYERCGHLFQDRYYSNSIETAAYFVAGLQYVFNNPVKAGLCKSALEYKWSSLRQWYMREREIPNIIVPYGKLPVKPELMVSNLSVKGWEPAEFVSDDLARRWVMETLKVEDWRQVQDADSESLRVCVQVLLKRGTSVRAIGRVLGLTRYSVMKWSTRGRVARGRV